MFFFCFAYGQNFTREVLNKGVYGPGVVITLLRSTQKRWKKRNIWKTNDVAKKYPQLYVIAFPSSYLVESGFDRVSHLQSKTRNRLDIVKSGDRRL